MASEKAPSPLRAVYVTGTIDTFFSDISIRQVYKNESAGPIEAVFRFPLPEGAAVIGWEARVGDRRIAGVIREREKAAEEYSAAIAGGHGAYLLEREAPDVFTASAGNLLAGQEAELALSYVCELPMTADGAARFTLPTTIPAKYTPARTAPEEAAAVNPLGVAPHVPYAMSLELHVVAPAPIASIASPTHAPDLEVTVAGREGRVRLARAVPMDGALVLEVAHAAPRAPHAWAERAEDGSACLALCLCPEFEAGAPPAPGEFLFLVDRSGSMAGSKMEQTKNALQIMLRALPPGSAFDLVGFGSSFRRLFAAPAPYGDASLAEAARAVAALQADLGGTELLAPLRALLAAPAPAGRPRHLFLLTDGEVSNTEECIAAVRAAPAGTRLFALGIGAGASEHLVNGLARAGRGHAAFIADGERVEGAALGQLRRALLPALASGLDWGLPAPRRPRRPPRRPRGERLLAYALLPPARGPPASSPSPPAAPPAPSPSPWPCPRGAGGAGDGAGGAGGGAGAEEAPDGRRRGGASSSSASATRSPRARRPSSPSSAATERERERPAPSRRRACAGALPEGRLAAGGDAAVDAVMLQEQCEELEVEAAEFKRSAARLKRSDAHCRTLVRATSSARPKGAPGLAGSAAAALASAVASVGGLFRKKERGAAGPPSSSPAASPAAARAELNRGTPAGAEEAAPGGRGAEGGRRHDAVLALQAASGLWALTPALAAALGRPSPPSPPPAPRRSPRRVGHAAGARLLEAACGAHREEWGLCADKARRALDALGAAPAPATAWGPAAAAAVSAA
eukprot:tig00000663_g3006.t1